MVQIVKNVETRWFEKDKRKVVQIISLCFKEISASKNGYSLKLI